MRHQEFRLAAALFGSAFILGVSAGAARAEPPKPLSVPSPAPVTRAQPTTPAGAPAKNHATAPTTAVAPVTGKAAAIKPAPVKTLALKPAPPAADDAYRCHPSDDIACTVVRETAEGLVIATLRGPGAHTDPPNWSVVSGVPPAPVNGARGTVYVVPTATFTPAYHGGSMPLPLPNGAPILD
jgi:hypothetical protein